MYLVLREGPVVLVYGVILSLNAYYQVGTAIGDGNMPQFTMLISCACLLILNAIVCAGVIVARAV